MGLLSTSEIATHVLVTLIGSRLQQASASVQIGGGGGGGRGGWHSLEWLHLLAIVLLADCSEAVDTPLINEVLEPRLPPVVSSAVVPLCSNYGLYCMVDVLLGHISQSICQACECVIVPAP